MRDFVGGRKITVLTMKDDMHSAYVGHVVEKKGKSGDLVVALVKDLIRLGHGENQITLKSDGENAIGDLVNDLVIKRKGITLVETSPRYESQSNGTAEVAVQSHEGMTRTMKLGLEDKLKSTISCSHAIVTWLVVHDVDVLTKYIVGKDGNTAYERIRGNKYLGDMLDFGCCVYFRIPNSDPRGGI